MLTTLAIFAIIKFFKSISKRKGREADVTVLIAKETQNNFLSTHDQFK